MKFAHSSWKNKDWSKLNCNKNPHFTGITPAVMWIRQIKDMFLNIYLNNISNDQPGTHCCQTGRWGDCFLYFSCSNSFMSHWLDKREPVLYRARSGGSYSKRFSTFKPKGINFNAMPKNTSFLFYWFLESMEMTPDHWPCWEYKQSLCVLTLASFPLTRHSILLRSDTGQWI